MMGWKKLRWMLHTYGFLNPYNECTLAYSQIFSLKTRGKRCGCKAASSYLKKAPQASRTHTCSSYAYKMLMAHSRDALLEQPRASAQRRPEAPAFAHTEILRVCFPTQASPPIYLGFQCLPTFLDDLATETVYQARPCASSDLPAFTQHECTHTSPSPPLCHGPAPLFLEMHSLWFVTAPHIPPATLSGEMPIKMPFFL